jgi:photosystem II stability/assembly factor-like uncharacterized protein
MRTILMIPLALVGCIDAADDDPTTSTDQTLHGHGPPVLVLTPQVSGTAARIQSIAPITEDIVWVSGAAGTVLRTTDGGETWVPRPVAGAETLAFRDIHAVSADIAYVLTNNGGANARIYKTVDAGATWTLHYQNTIPLTFYDCFAFWNPWQAVAVPDAEPAGTGDVWRFDAIRMLDGATWENIGDAFGPGVPGEGLFPTSGNCVTTLGQRRAYAVVAGADPSRVVITDDQGDSWTSYDIPIAGGPSGGGMNVLFRDRRHGIISGGDVATPTVPQDNIARTHDGGETWELATPTPFPGAAYALAYLPRGWHHRWLGGHRPQTIVAAGPSGAAWSRDEGDTWDAISDAGTGNFSVEFASARRGWLVGAAGKIIRIDVEH